MAARSAMSKRPSHLLSTLAETAEEYIKLECARRRNQAGIRRRSSLLEQYNVRVPTSRLRERQAQTRHHEFLVRRDNKSALDVIIDRVRELAELYSLSRSGASPLGPMEKARLLAWADDVEKVLYEFEPSENHSDDPIVRILEKLQFLQDGHVCLAEVAVDARFLLEKWERDGIFDTSSSDGDEDGDTIAEDDEGGAAAVGGDGALTERSHRSGTHMPHSYAYETIRQRAAANVIKRVVLVWVRSQEAFRDRVDEIQLFGRTTHSLMKELTSTANMRRPTAVAPPSDIFDLVKVKRDGMYANSIGFIDLMKFSKYVALFPVDQAIRRVEELETKRFLYLNRCALKLQTIWRKARKEFQARRMRKLVEELRLQREKQEQEERERERLLLLNASKSSTPDEGEKRKSVLSSSRKHRPSAVSTTPPSTASSRASISRGEDALSESQPSTPQSARQRASVSGAKRKESKARTSDSQERKTHRVSRVKSIHARERSRFDDDDGDTKDVENAWQSFLDSAAGLEECEDLNSADTLIPATGLVSEPTPDTESLEHEREAEVVMLLTLEDDWKSWSDSDENGALRETDDEADLKAEEKIARQLSLAASTALPITPLSSESSFANLSELNRPRRSLRNSQNASSALGRESDAQRSLSRDDAMHPLDEPPLQSSLAYQLDSDADRFRIKKTRIGKLSVMKPFAELEAPSESPTARVKLPKVSKKKHLHEIDYGGVTTSSLALLQLADPLVATEDSSGSDGEKGGESELDHGKARNERAAEPPRRAQRKKSTRKRRVDMIRHSISVRETENITYSSASRPHNHQQLAAADAEAWRLREQDEMSEKARVKPSDEPTEQFRYPVQNAATAECEQHGGATCQQCIAGEYSATAAKDQEEAEAFFANA